MCPKIAGGGSAGPLGIGRVPELEPRATRPRVSQRGEISPLFDYAISHCFARCAPPLRFFVSAYYFTNVVYDSDEDDCSSPGHAIPRIDITDLNPQHSDIYTKEWSGKELQKKWTDIRKLVSPYFSKWNSSGHNKGVQDANDEDGDDNHSSITDFLPHPEGDRFQSYTAAASSKGKGRPKGKTMHKEKVIKYMHLLFKGDDDLMGMAMKNGTKRTRSTSTSPS